MLALNSRKLGLASAVRLEVLVLRHSFGGAGVGVFVVVLVGLGNSIGVTAGAILDRVVRPDRKCGGHHLVVVPRSYIACSSRHSRCFRRSECERVILSAHQSPSALGYVRAP